MEPKQWMNRKSWMLHLEEHLWNGKYCHQLRSLIATVITNKFKIQVCLLYFLSCFLYFSHKNENIKILLNNYGEKTWTKLRQGCTVVVLCGILSSHIWKNFKLSEKGLKRQEKTPISSFLLKLLRNNSQLKTDYVSALSTFFPHGYYKFMYLKSRSIFIYSVNPLHCHTFWGIVNQESLEERSSWVVR